MKPSEVPDYLKGHIAYSASGVITFNDPDKGLLFLEPDVLMQVIPIEVDATDG